MRLPLWTTLLFLLTVFSGCTSDDGGPDASDGTGAAAERPIWILDGHGGERTMADYPGDVPSFTQLTASTRISGEPTIGVTRTKSVWYPAIDFDAVSGTLPKTRFMRSQDGGITWEDKSPNVAGVTDTHPYSFDPYLYVDPTTGRVFALDMGPQYNCNHFSWSDDDGGTWVTQYFTCPIPTVDHPSIVAGPASELNLGVAYPNNLYLCTNAVELGASHCATSYDGGATWLNDQIVFNNGCNGLTGHVHASWADGTVYVPKVACGVPSVGISHDGGRTWETTAVYTPSGADDPLRGVGHEGSVATDRSGNVYSLWIGDNGNRTYLARSTDQGASWSEPWDVTVPGVTAVNLPSITAGEDGRVAFLYLGTTTPSGWRVHERDGQTGERLHPDELRNATWNAYIGIGLGADTDDPVFAVTLPHDLDAPLKRGQCEGRCFGDVGGMYDFFDIQIDPIDGRVWSAMVDVCTLECDQPGADGDTWQRAFGVVGKQTGGTFLLDAPIEAR